MYKLLRPKICTFNFDTFLPDIFLPILRKLILKKKNNNCYSMFSLITIVIYIKKILKYNISIPQLLCVKQYEQ